MTEVQRREPQIIDGRPVEPARAQIHWINPGQQCALIGRDMAEIGRTLRLLRDQGVIVKADPPIVWGHDRELLLVNCVITLPPVRQGPVAAVRTSWARVWWAVAAAALSVAVMAVVVMLVLATLAPYLLAIAGVAVVVVGASMLLGRDSGGVISVVQKVTIRK